MPGSDWNTYIRSMFGSISGRYDLMNTLMTFGMDRLWRRLTLEMACLPPGGLLLDVGAGTGKIAREALRRDPAARVVAADLTLDMMKTGRRTVGGRAWWCNADALALPFPEDSFDAATSGFLMRNVPDMRGAFQEQFRVVKPGGMVVCLDTCPPPDTVLKPLILFHFRFVIPFLGTLVTGNSDAYRYLPRSTSAFKKPEEIVPIMEQVGFRETAWRRFMFGTMGLVWGRKPRR